MSDKKFDELLRNKLNQREFEWDGAYWESAQELIAAQEKGKKRRGFWLWIMAGLLLMSAGAYFIYERGENRSMVDGPQSIAKQSTANSQKLIANSQKPIARKSMVDGPQSIVKPPTVNSQKPIARKSMVDGPQSIVKPPTVNSQKPIARKSMVDGPQSIVKPPTANSQKPIARKSMVDGPQSIVKPPTANSQKLIVNSQKPIANSQQLAINFLQIPYGMHNIAALDSQNIYLKAPELLISPIFSPSSSVKMPRHQLSFRAGVLATNTIGKSEQILSPWTKATDLSIRYSYRLATRISLYGGLGYQARAKLSLDSTYRSLEYNFGVSIFETNIDPQSLHLLTIPMGITFDLKGRHQIHAGLEFAQLINVNSIVTQMNYNAQGELIAMNSSRSWGYLQGLRKMDTRAILGYSFFLGRRISLGLEAQYGLRDLTDDAFFRNADFDRNLQLRGILQYDLGRW